MVVADDCGTEDGEATCSALTPKRGDLGLKAGDAAVSGAQLPIFAIDEGLSVLGVGTQAATEGVGHTQFEFANLHVDLLCWR